MSSNTSECGIRCRPILHLTEHASASTGDGVELPFNYVPSFEAGIVFVALFSIVTGALSPFHLPGSHLTCRSTAAHLGQALHARAWWLLPTVVTGGVGEIIGWIGRLWGSQAPTDNDPFLMQWVTRFRRRITTHIYLGSRRRSSVPLSSSPPIS